MQKHNEVEEARALMIEAANWSVIKWLKEKKRVRKTADKANETLWALQKEAKLSWSADLRKAYDELVAEAGTSDKAGRQQSAKANTAAADNDVKALARKVKEADDEAWRVHMDAEDTFDRAEKILSTSMAREGSKKALASWDLFEKAIVMAEGCIRSHKTAR